MQNTTKIRESRYVQLLEEIQTVIDSHSHFQSIIVPITFVKRGLGKKNDVYITLTEKGE